MLLLTPGLERDETMVPYSYPTSPGHDERTVESSGAVWKYDRQVMCMSLFFFVPHTLEQLGFLSEL